ncbi:hypothetical protein E1A91_A09G030500v1 [Gossypium mustelinum]|uniref:Uncharacterized protein n=1 Tax=Gossypium mustelinum TaxID=34275 RepID=A0A5D2XTP1_GOSMU|nr:hypothetical protein E1A91_A09G030500v1 [Gossypium mustelinum]
MDSWMFEYQPYLTEGEQNNRYKASWSDDVALGVGRTEAWGAGGRTWVVCCGARER